MTLAVVYFNESLNLPRLLLSLEENFQNNTLPIQFLFLDNASEDNSFEIIENWMADKNWVKGENIKRSTNHMAQARQQALAICNDPWLAFVDADSKLEKDWYKNVRVAIANSNPSVVAIGGQSTYESEQPWHTYAESLASRFPIGKNGEQRVILDHVPTNNYILKKESALQVGGFDPFFDRVGEDLDLNIRLNKIGDIVYDPSFKVKHFLPIKKYPWYKKMAYYGRAQSFVALKYKNGVPMKKFIPAIFIIVLLCLLEALPIETSLLFVLFSLIPRIRFLLFSVLFYGLGEWVGATRMILNGKIFTKSPQGA